MDKKLVITRFFLFNFLVSFIAISYFSYEYQFPIYWIVIHQIVTLYIIIAFYYLCLISTKSLPEFLSYILITFLMVMFQLTFLFLHSTYYIGKSNWGHPLTIKLFNVYLDELNYLIESLFITPIHFYIALFIITAFISLPVLLFSKKIWQHFKIKKFSLSSKIHTFIALFLFIIIPLLFFKIDRVYNSIVRTDPLITFFLYEWNAQDEEVVNYGERKYNEEKQYPTEIEFNKKNVILIICDALRSDHIYTNGYKRKTSTFIDSISSLENAIKVDNFFATSSRSFLGISNILSSNYSISYKNFFLYDVLKKLGYTTNFILSGDHTHHYGLKRHYGKNIDNYYDGYNAVKMNSSSSVNNDEEIVINKLKKVAKFNNKPAFFYLHFMSTHQIGILNPKYKRYKPNSHNSLLKKIPTEVLINDYDNRVTQLDNYLKETIKILKVKGYLKNSIIIITSDHGQALGEKGYKWHVSSTYLGEISIPLIIIDSDKLDKKIRKIAPLSNQLDVAPTITDLLAIPTPKNWKGTSIFNKRKNDFIFQQENEFYSCIWINNKFSYQYIFNKKTKKEEVYNITIDSKQYSNLIHLMKKEKLNNIKQHMESFFSNRLK